MACVLPGIGVAETVACPIPSNITGKAQTISIWIGDQEFARSPGRIDHPTHAHHTIPGELGKTRPGIRHTEIDCTAHLAISAVLREKQGLPGLGGCQPRHVRPIDGPLPRALKTSGSPAGTRPQLNTQRLAVSRNTGKSPWGLLTTLADDTATSLKPARAADAAISARSKPG